MQLETRRRPRKGHRARGQSLVEFALVVPILLLLTLTAIDFGRIYLGYINLQNMARIAANYAALHPTAWGSPGDATIRDFYQQQIRNDASATNCRLPLVSGTETAPAPTFPGGTNFLGSARVQLTCNFGVITPIVTAIVGSTVAVSASAEFPVRTAMIVPGVAAPGVRHPPRRSTAARRAAPGH